MWDELVRHVADALTRLGEAFLSVIPALCVLVGALAVGVVVGVVLRLVLRVLFRLARIDRAPAGVLRAAGLRAQPASLAAAFSLWAAVIVALAVGVNALEPGGLRDALREIVALLPRLLTSAFVFVVGLGAGSLARRSALLAGVNAGLPWARPLARLVHVAVLTFFAAMALEYLGVGTAILVAAFSIVFGGFVLALALAFGLGGRGLARAYLEKRLRAEEEENGVRHV